MLTSNGLIRSMTTTFNDARWAAPRSVPKLIIESLMSDETSHQVRVPSGTPAWLLLVQAKMKAGNKHQCLMAPPDRPALDDDHNDDDDNHSDDAGNHDETPDSDDADDGNHNDDDNHNDDHDTHKQSKKRKLSALRTRNNTQSQTWPVCVVRRSLSWLTLSGNLMYTPMITPPSAMRVKGAEYLWSV